MVEAGKRKVGSKMLRKKDMESLIAKQNKEIEELNQKVFEYEKELKEFKEREDSIVEALTTASETRKRVLSQAEKELANSQAQARKAIENAKNEANAIIAAAQEKGSHILSEANNKCERMEMKSQTIIDEKNKLHEQMNLALANMAQKLYEYIAFFQTKFNIDSVVKDTKSIEECKINFPDEYESPAELYHYILKINAANECKGEEKAEEKAEEIEEKAEKPAPKFVTVTQDLLSNDEIDSVIKVPATLGDECECGHQESEGVEAEDTSEILEDLSEFETELEKVRDAVLSVLEE